MTSPVNGGNNWTQELHRPREYVCHDDITGRFRIDTLLTSDANESHTVSELVAGVDLGGTTVSIALADPNGTIAAESQIATNSHEGPESVLARIAESIEHLSTQTGRMPATLGMGVPGLVDLVAGRTRFLPNLPTQWRDVPVANILQERLNCPVSLLNDARAATLGELRFGPGRDVSTMAMFTLGTGVGGGVAVNGRLLLGPFGSAGELGHQTIVPDGPPCGCGNRGCLETLVSGPAFIGEAIRLMNTGGAPRLYEMVQGDASRVSPKEMAQAPETGICVCRMLSLSGGPGWVSASRTWSPQSTRNLS